MRVLQAAQYTNLLDDSQVVVAAAHEVVLNTADLAEVPERPGRLMEYDQAQNEEVPNAEVQLSGLAGMAAAMEDAVNSGANAAASAVVSGAIEKSATAVRTTSGTAGTHSRHSQPSVMAGSTSELTTHTRRIRRLHLAA